MWLSSSATTAIFAFSFLRHPEYINAPGEVGEVFTGALIAVILALILATGVIGLILSNKK